MKSSYFRQQTIRSTPDTVPKEDASLTLIFCYAELVDFKLEPFFSHHPDGLFVSIISTKDFCFNGFHWLTNSTESIDRDSAKRNDFIFCTSHTYANKLIFLFFFTKQIHFNI